jgi:hypothetical protein
MLSMNSPPCRLTIASLRAETSSIISLTSGGVGANCVQSMNDTSFTTIAIATSPATSAASSVL